MSNKIRRLILSQSLVDKSKKSKYLTIESIKEANIPVVITSIGNAANYAKLEFSKNGADWLPCRETITLNPGEYVSFKGLLTPTSGLGIGVSQITGPFNLSGNCFSIVCGDLYDNMINNSLVSFVSNSPYCFYRLFYNLSVTNVSKDFLPLPKVGNYMYQGMFQGCSSLVTAPELPATTLGTSCYNSMFGNCSSLVTAPELPATTLAGNCYTNMFRGCSKLNYVKALFLTTPSTTYTSNWLNGVASSGTFVKNKNATWNVTGVSGIPAAWTVLTE